MLLDVICHQKLNFFSLFPYSLSIPCATTLTKKSSLITEAWNKEIPQLCMALEVTFFFPSFLSLNLCMSLWIHCSHTVEQRQSYRKRWNEKAVWGDIESRVDSTPDAGVKLVCFLLFWISLVFLNVGEPQDVEMESQSQGIVQLQIKGPTLVAARLRVVWVQTEMCVICFFCPVFLP